MTLKTKEQHNKERIAEYEKQNGYRKTGVACKCGKEFYRDSIVLASNPPKMRVVCPNCDNTDTILA